MSTYTDATVARCATIIARTDADQLARILAGTQQAPAQNRAPRKPRKTDAQIKQDRKWAQMTGKPATFGQMERVNECYADADLRTFATLAAFRRVFDMEQASREFARMTGRYAG